MLHLFLVTMWTLNGLIKYLFPRTASLKGIISVYADTVKHSVQSKQKLRKVLSCALHIRL
jgi:hypothetical protein